MFLESSCLPPSLIAKAITIYFVRGNWLTDECMAAIVENQEKGFNWQEKLNDLLDLRGTQDRGRGVLMTNMFCDQLIYNEKGNRALLLVKGDALKCK